MRVGPVDVCLLDEGFVAKLLLKATDEIDQFAAFCPFEDTFIVYFAGIGFDDGVLRPFGDVYYGSLPWKISQEDTECEYLYILRGTLCFWLSTSVR